MDLDLSPEQTELRAAVRKFAEMEGLDAHGRSAEVRMGIRS